MVRCGVDILEIKRVQKLLKHQRFLSKHFTESEINYFYSKKLQPQTIAANFAGKEAFSKAVGTGFIGFSFIDLEILRDENNKPFINLGYKLDSFKKNYHMDISLSHSKEYAVAQVVLLKK